MLEVLDILLQFWAGVLIAGGIVAFVIIFISRGWYYSIKNFFKKFLKNTKKQLTKNLKYGII